MGVAFNTIYAIKHGKCPYAPLYEQYKRSYI